MAKARRENVKDEEPATDPSTPEPTGYRRWSEEWWGNRKPGVKEHRCTAHRRTGEQCRNPAILGATVCRFHGGAAKQVVHAARVRLQNAADKMARELLGMATIPNVSDSVKITAIRDALDRAGLKPVTAVDSGHLHQTVGKGFRGNRESCCGTEIFREQTGN